MRPLLFVRADEVETFGVGPAAVAEAGAEIRVWDAIGGEPEPSLDDVGGIVQFGSSFNVEHADDQPFLHRIRDLTQAAQRRGTPYLGICFGAQSLAWSLGAEVKKAPVKEIGYVPIRPTQAAVDDPVLGHLVDGDMCFQWHMDTFDLPDGATLLVAGDDVAHQAYRIGATTWATQFHFEVDRAEIEAWLRDIGDKVAGWGKSTPEVLAEADRWQAAHEERGAEVFRRFVEVTRRA
jgi:GMP synthase-like glutamine amidotransferase